MRPWVEVEELPTQSLAPRTTSRVPLTGMIAVAAVVVLLAGGFGLLGGRSTGTPAASPPGSPVAALPSATEPPGTPRVTPWTTCSAEPDQPPAAILEVDGHQTRGLAESLEFNVGETFAPGPSLSGEGELLAAEVPMDAITEIWIDGGACAVAWTISLVGNNLVDGGQTLDSVSNEDRDPALSAQNRFEVVVAGYPGDHVLRALFVFEHFAVRTAWSIHVPPLEAPNVSLTGPRSGEIPTVIGCDMTIRLANGAELPVGRCARDLPHDPLRRVEVKPGEVVEFAIDGWAASDTFVDCGELVDHRFLPRNDPPCIRDQDPLFAGVRFPAPEETGPWTLAMSTCAVRIRVTGSGFDELCGTWYANVLVRD